MSDKFEDIALRVREKIVARLGEQVAKERFIYQELCRILKEWKTGELTTERTEIGVAAVKYFDSGDAEDDAIADELCELAEMYRLRAWKRKEEKEDS